MVIRFGKICLGRRVASIAQLGLVLDEQEFLFLGVMGRVAVEAADLATGVRGFCKMRLLVTFAVAGQTSSTGFLSRLPFEYKNLGLVAATSNVVGAGTVAALTALV
jgi:hypothetical protein